MKRSNDIIKVSLPGILQVRRDQYKDVVFHDATGEQEGLLQCVFKNGKRFGNEKNISETRLQAITNWKNKNEGRDILVDTQLREMQMRCLEL